MVGGSQSTSIGAGSRWTSARAREASIGADASLVGAFYALNTASRLLAHPESPIRSAREAARVLIHTGSHKSLDGICGALEVDRAAPEVATSYSVLSRYGNLTGASLGFMIADALRGAKGHALLVSFGLSFSASAGILTVP